MPKINVKGMSIKDILSMDYEEINKLSKSDLARVTGRITAVAKKRVTRLERSDLGESPALRGLLKSRGKDVDLSVKGKDRNQLMKLWSNSRNFVKAKTSTITGYKKVIKKTKEILTEKTGRTYSTGEVNTMFSALHKMQEMGIVEGHGTAGSQYALEQISEYLSENPNASIDDIINGIGEEYESYYRNTYESTEDLDDYEEIDIFDDLFD